MDGAVDLGDAFDVDPSLTHGLHDAGQLTGPVLGQPYDQVARHPDSLACRNSGDCSSLPLIPLWRAVRAAAPILLGKSRVRFARGTARHPGPPSKRGNRPRAPISRPSSRKPGRGMLRGPTRRSAGPTSAWPTAA